MNITIKKTANSRINEVDFDNLVFGKSVIDHMIECDYADGEWGDIKIHPTANFSLSPLSSSFHYGQTIFEGMKAYKSNGNISLFRPDQNFKRFNKSAERMMMPTFPEDKILEALKQLLELDQAWIPEGEGQSLYIRPTMIATEPTVMARHANQYKMFIIAFPVGTYFSGKVKVKIETEYSRAAQGGVGEAKCGGNYAGSFYPVNEAIKAGYDQVLWTDAATHTLLEEAGVMNLMFRINDTLYTPELSGSILRGITRKSLLQLAEDLGIKTEEKKLSISEIVEAHQNGSLKEAFGVGTAAIVSQIRQIDYNEQRMVLADCENSYALRLKEELYGIQTGKLEDKHQWIVSV